MEPYVRSEEATKELQEARRARWRQRHAENKDYYNAKSREYRYYAVHKDELFAKDRAKYASDPNVRQKQQERKKKWREENKERISEYNKKYRDSKKLP